MPHRINFLNQLNECRSDCTIFSFMRDLSKGSCAGSTHLNQPVSENDSISASVTDSESNAEHHNTTDCLGEHVWCEDFFVLDANQSSVSNFDGSNNLSEGSTAEGSIGSNKNTACGCASGLGSRRYESRCWRSIHRPQPSEEESSEYGSVVDGLFKDYKSFKDGPDYPSSSNLNASFDYPHLSRCQTYDQFDDKKGMVDNESVVDDKDASTEVDKPVIKSWCALLFSCCRLMAISKLYTSSGGDVIDCTNS